MRVLDRFVRGYFRCQACEQRRLHPAFYPKMDPVLFFRASISIQRCAFVGCQHTPTGQCEHKMCDFRWCPQHLNHRHCLCRYPSCANYATTYSYSKNAECCRDHHKIWETRIYYYTGSSSFSSTCQTCGKYLSSERKAIGHCTNCNGMWQTVPKKEFMDHLVEFIHQLNEKLSAIARIATECGKLFAKKEFMDHLVEFIHQLNEV